MKRFIPLSILIFSTVIAHAGDKLVNAQGRLTDDAGNPLNGNHTVIFRLYDVSTAPVSSRIWEDTLTVNLSSGLFNVALGKNASLDGLAFNKTYYLGLEVSGDSQEMIPREPLAASPYALGSLGDFRVGKSLQVNGSVGVGVSSPTSSLQVGGGILARGGVPGGYGSNNNGYAFSGNGGDIDSGMFSSSDGRLEFYTNASERMRIISNGNVGIGEDNPGVSLQVNGGIRARGGNPGSFGVNNAGYAFYGNGGDDDSGLFSSGDGQLEFYSNAQERVRINSNGYVGVGTVNPTVKLEVMGDAKFNGVFYSSDRSLKKNIQTLPSDTLNRVLQLNGVRYEWDIGEFKKKYGRVQPPRRIAQTAEERRAEEVLKDPLVDSDTGLSVLPQLGLIAQEVEAQFPELVHTDAEGVKSVDYGKFSAVLLEALKAQQQVIQQMRKDLNDLKAKGK